MAKLFGLTAEQQKRLARVADKVEGQPIQRANQKSGTSKPSPSFWVELTEEDPDNPGRYAWKMVDYVDHEWTDRDPEIASPEGEYTAIEANLGGGMVGQRVEVHFYGYDAEGRPRYLFGRAATPFLARIVTAGPNGEPDYPRTSWRYWAKAIRIKQNGTQTSDDAISQFEDTGDAFTVTNLAELRWLDMLLRTQSSTRMLVPGSIIGVWVELDSEGVPRYVCSEHPYEMCAVRITGPADGDFAGKVGFHTATELRPAYQWMSALPVPTSTWHPTHMFESVNIGTGISTLVVNIHGAPGIYHAPTLKVGSTHLGIRWGWTAETTPRRVVLVFHATIEDFTYSTADEGLLKLINRLKEAGYMAGNSTGT